DRHYFQLKHFASQHLPQMLSLRLILFALLSPQTQAQRYYSPSWNVNHFDIATAQDLHIIRNN
ncbi:MAG TPA: hypothetical protein VF762_00745, partial [Blastocatellia bacterium]